MTGRTPGELEATMTAREFAEYQALFAIQPYGPWADDLRAARICAEVANSSQNIDWKKRGNKFFTAADFMPNPAPQQADTPDAQRTQAVVRVVQQVTASRRRTSGARKNQASR